MKEKMNASFNFTKSFFELFKIYWGYFMTVVAVTTFIWTIGVKSERSNSEKESIKGDIIEIKSSQANQLNKIDSILVIVNKVNYSQYEVVQSQNSLRNSYVNFVANINDIINNGLTTKQFIEYMDGVQFSLVPPDTDKKQVNDTISIQVDTIKSIIDIKHIKK